MAQTWITAVICTNRTAADVRPSLEAISLQANALEGAEAVVVTSDLDGPGRDEHERQAGELGAIALHAGPGLSAARNAALAGRAPADVVAYTDDDAIPEAGWLRNLVAHWQRASAEVACIGGAIVPSFEIDPPKWMGEGLWMSYSLLDLGPGLIEMDPAGGRDVWGANMSFRCGPALDAGGFDESRGPWRDIPSFGEETDLERRLQAAGHTTLYAGDVRVRHLIGADRLSLRSLGRRAFYRGLSASDDGRIGIGGGAGKALKAGAGLGVAALRRDHALAAERWGRLSEGAGAVLAPLTRRRLRRRGWTAR